MAELGESLEKNQIVLCVLAKEGYRQGRVELIRKAKDSIQKIAYVTSNLPYQSIVDELRKENIPLEGFYFIDAVTRTVQEPPPAENCTFVEGPTALTDISLAFSEAINERQCDGSFIDTISTFGIYQDKGAVVKLVHNLVTKSRVAGKKGIFLALREDGETFIKDISLFMDTVLEF
ncbi:MAG: hypothetical protein GXP63_04990 [DPANN group archaeon]|nr:hypothetical protein [DPANN group archaeon]